MMFASKTPRDLDPIVSSDCPTHGPWCHGCALEYRVDTVPTQHNEPNPILVAFRADPRKSSATAWLDLLTGGGKHFTSDQEDHAYRVLTRLAHFAEQETPT